MNSTVVQWQWSIEDIFFIILPVSQLDRLQQNKTAFDRWISELKAGQAPAVFLKKSSYVVVIDVRIVLLDDVCVFAPDCICVRARQCLFAYPSAHVRISECLWQPAHPLCARVCFCVRGAISVKFGLATMPLIAGEKADWKDNRQKRDLLAPKNFTFWNQMHLKLTV